MNKGIFMEKLTKEMSSRCGSGNDAAGAAIYRLNGPGSTKRVVDDLMGSAFWGQGNFCEKTLRRGKNVTAESSKTGSYKGKTGRKLVFKGILKSQKDADKWTSFEELYFEKNAADDFLAKAKAAVLNLPLWMGKDFRFATGYAER